jgi:hypothetical protein
MKLSKVSFYQAVEIPVFPKQNFNTVSKDVISGVELELFDACIIVSHKDWIHDVVVPTANVRYATRDKETIMTFTKEILSAANQIEVKKSIQKKRSNRGEVGQAGQAIGSNRVRGKKES